MKLKIWYLLSCLASLCFITTDSFAYDNRAYKNNLQSCIAGNHFKCDKSQLNAKDLIEVEKAQYQHNFKSCIFGNVKRCDQSSLSATDRKKLPNLKVTSNNNRKQFPAKPHCAENGSCYGDISPYNRKPKTTYVKGYYRKDGTYVRGHYRSKG